MRFIILDTKNKVIATREGRELIEGEIQSELGELGQIMQEDNSFIDAPIETFTPQPTLEDKINYLYYKGLGVI
jgi:hypothetical protein